MKGRISSIVLGVTDLQCAISFYSEGMGHTLGYHTESIAFFDLSNIQLVLFARQSLSRESHVEFSDRSIPPLSLVHQVESKADVDAIIMRASTFGAKVTRPACETCHEGYSGYFSDPEGFLWEVVWDPNLNPD
jgi:predicted lactoylglutathione lyase